MDRREFLKTTATAGAFHIVPRHVLGRGYVPPSDKIALAYIGLGTQGLRELIPLLQVPDIQVVAVCDPNKNSTDYVDWSKDGIRNGIAKFLENPSWREGITGIPGGRDVGREVIETYYGKTQASGTYNGIASYADFRELLAKEHDLNAVKIMTPDHLHAIIAIAAMNKGKHVMVHKPLANRMSEAKLVIDTARRTRVATHFSPWDSNGSMEYVMAWINDGAIGTLREVHNWTGRPFWPQYATVPTDTPPVPKDFDWDLWLGPEQYRPYHPHYTHAVFRGWYDFGGGSLADMGHYSLWTVFKALNLGPPLSADPMRSHVATIVDGVSRVVRNDYSFPAACSIRFKFAARGAMAPVDLFWYDGGMRPQTPDELEADNQELPAEGMMFVGDKGKILAGFRVNNPRLIPEKRMSEYQGPKPPPPAPPEAGGPRRPRGIENFAAACRSGQQTPASFLEAGPLSEMVNLGAVALRVGRKVVYDSASMTITNVPEANKYLTRDYRAGWEPLKTD